MKRILYLGYYLRQLDRVKFRLFLNAAKTQSGRPAISLVWDMVISSLKYNISLLEYFQFQFHTHRDRTWRRSWAGTGYMYEYQLYMNPPQHRSALEDKVKFLTVYKRFVQHGYASLQQLEKEPALARTLIEAPAGKLVFKHSKGQCGNGIVVLPSRGMDPRRILELLHEQGNDYVEEFVLQHPDLMRMSPSGLNTVRVVSQVRKDGSVDLLAARLRITVNSSVDNLAAGNMAAPIDLETGRVCGPAVYSDITKTAATHHPVTNTEIIGFAIPFWNETAAMIREAAKTAPENRSVGWDVAITERGPELIEGNHDWCKLLWQLPAQQGLKEQLVRYRNEG